MVKTCPETITTLAMKKQSYPRSTSTDPAELDFSAAMDSVLNPTYEIVQSPPSISKLHDIQDFLSNNNATKLVLAFNVDKKSELLAWNLLSVLDIPDNVTISRLQLSEITPKVFQKAMTNVLSPSTHDPPDKQLLDRNVVDSLLTQRVLDRTLSFTLSQALYKCLGEYYSAGRVQSHVLNLLAEVKS
jgi:DNA topoisomerase IA